MALPGLRRETAEYNASRKQTPVLCSHGQRPRGTTVTRTLVVLSVLSLQHSVPETCDSMESHSGLAAHSIHTGRAKCHWERVSHVWNWVMWMYGLSPVQVPAGKEVAFCNCTTGGLQCGERARQGQSRSKVMKIR